MCAFVFFRPHCSSCDVFLCFSRQLKTKRLRGNAEAATQGRQILSLQPQGTPEARRREGEKKELAQENFTRPKARRKL